MKEIAFWYIGDSHNVDGAVGGKVVAAGMIEQAMLSAAAGIRPREAAYSIFDYIYLN